MFFDGVDDYFEVPHHPDFLLANAISIAAWVKPSAPGARCFNVSKTTPGTCHFECYADPELTFHFWQDPGSWSRGISTGAVADTEWHHVSAVYGAAKVKLYVDGMLDTEVSMGAAMTAGGQPIFIGKNSGPPEVFSHGSVDDIRIYNREISSNDVSLLARMRSDEMSISGTVGYGGGQTGTFWVLACTTSNLWQTNVSALASLGEFTIEGLTLGSNYWFHSFRDSDQDGSNDFWEAHGSYTGNPHYAGAPFLRPHIQLYDPDSDGDGLVDWWELDNGMNPTNVDTDADGLPDGWEVEYGTGATNASANLDADGDGLGNMFEYRHGLRPDLPDTDGDGVSDYAEYVQFGTDPLVQDSDGDGINDGWEVAHGLNPTVDDSDLDQDLDWLSNLEEYNGGLNPTNADTNADGTNDFEQVMGKSGARYSYDRVDRLVGVEYERGRSIGYAYDGNGSMFREIHLDRDEDGDGLPDLWEFLNGLCWTNGAGEHGLYGDLDGDGWSNFQEWQAASDPADAGSIPRALGTSSQGISLMQTPATTCLFSVATGQLDQERAEEVVVGLDCWPVPPTNSIRVLTQWAGGWTTQSIAVGQTAVNSIVVGQASGKDAPGIYIGWRNQSNRYGVAELSAAGDAWSMQTVARSAAGIARVIGLNAEGKLLAEIWPDGGPVQGLYGFAFTNGFWRSTLIDTNLAQEAAGAIDTSPVLSDEVRSARLLASHMMQIAFGEETQSVPVPGDIWAMGKNVARGGTATMSASDGSISLNTQVPYGAPQGVPTASAWAQTSLQWGQRYRGIVISVGGQLGYGGQHGTIGFYRARYGGTTLHEQTGGDGHFCLIHLVMHEGTVFHRRKPAAGSWGPWSAVPANGVLHFDVSVSQSPRYDGGGANIGVAISYQPIPSFSGVDSRLSGDCQQSNAAYRASTGDWYFRQSSPQTWQKAQLGAWSAGCNLLSVTDNDLNTFAHGSFPGEHWVGGYKGHESDAWRWLTAPPGSYSNWSETATNMLADSSCRAEARYIFLNTNGLWGVSSNDVLRSGLCEANEPAIFRRPSLISAALPSDVILSQNAALAIGSLRSGAPNRYSVCCGFVSDVDGNGRVNSGDEFGLAEYGVSPTSVQEVATSFWRLDGMELSSSYGLACADILNTSTDLLFTAEPDGTVYSWLDTSGTGGLAKVVFDAHHRGMSWHQLSRHRGLEPGDSLIGLLEDPASPGAVSVVRWPPLQGLPAVDACQQTAPATRIMPEPAAGAGVSRVDVRIWDAEGNRSLPFLQYQPPGSTNWADASVLRIDGQAYGMAMSVEAMPTGTTHSLTWSSGTDLGATFSGTVLLQARSLDNTAWGEWSDPVLYHVAASGDSDGDGIPDSWELARRLDPLSGTGDDGPSGDPDGDGVDNLSEYLADTDPMDGDSFLAITGVSWGVGGLRVAWQGGTGAWQYLLRKADISVAGGPWTAVFTNEPPTEAADEWGDHGATNGRGFYRVRAERK